MTKIFHVSADFDDADADMFVEADDAAHARDVWERDESVKGLIDCNPEGRYVVKVRSVPAPSGSAAVRRWDEPGGAEILLTSTLVIP